MRKFVLIGIFLFLTACDQVEMKQEEAGPQENGPSSIESSSLEDHIKIAIQGGDPEKYTVQFSWPRIEDGKILRVRLGGVLAEVMPNQTFFTHTVTHNQLLTYSFDVLDAKRTLERTITKTALIPFDFVVKESTPVAQPGKIEANRVYLNSDIPLLVESHSVDIVANEIHARGGSIETFPELVKIRVNDGGIETIKEIPPTADKNQNGRPGGNISITANKLYGPIKITMRGENGGTGDDGLPYPSRAAQGKPAGAGSSVGSYPGGDYPGDQFLCKYGARAGDGAPGADGRPGLPGGNGGDTGHVKISIKQFLPVEGVETPRTDDSPGPVTVIQLPGANAKGGNPGPPQQGGRGGKGNSGKDWDCSGDPGIDGPNGNPGSPGKDGIPGKRGVKCIYVGSENINACSE